MLHGYQIFWNRYYDNLIYIWIPNIIDNHSISIYHIKVSSNIYQLNIHQYPYYVQYHNNLTFIVQHIFYYSMIHPYNDLIYDVLSLLLLLHYLLIDMPVSVYPTYLLLLNIFIFYILSMMIISHWILYYCLNPLNIYHYIFYIFHFMAIMDMTKMTMILVMLYFYFS